MALKLRQGQIWIHGGEFIRIVQLERLEVGYKTFPSLDSVEGKHQRATKKAFCRLLKGCQLLAPAVATPVPVLAPVSRTATEVAAPAAVPAVG